MNTVIEENQYLDLHEETRHRLWSVRIVRACMKLELKEQ